jgi:hypothetical protein
MLIKCVMGKKCYNGLYNSLSPFPPPPIQHRCFISDAAGIADLQCFNGNEGVGGVGFDEEGRIISAYQLFWQESFISFLDEKGSQMGSKTTSLEVLGVLLHLLYFPELI